MMTTTEEATLEALLAPWWDVFSDGKLMIQHDRWTGGLRRQFYAFCFEISTPTRDAVRDQYNAFELLCLASVLNPTAFMRMVRDKCSFVAPFMHWDGFVEDQVVPCRLWVALEDTPGKRKLSKWRRDALMLVLSAGMSRLDSDRFLKTREALLAMAETSEKRKQCEDMTIDVEVRLVYLSEDPLVAALERLVTSHEQRVRNDRQGQLRPYPFRLEAIDLVYDDIILMLEFGGFTPRIISCLENYARVTGLGLRSIRFMDCIYRDFVDDSHWHKVVGDWMSMMTAAATGIQSPVNNRLGAQSVVSVIPAKHTFAIFCSGIMHSRGVEHWALENVFGTSEERFDKWYWFMYAMFHVSATHSIKSLEIREEDFPAEDLEQVSRIVCGSPSVLHEIYNPFVEPLNFTEYNTEMFDYEGRPRMGSSITLKAGATIHLEMVQRGSMHVTVAQDHTPFQVIYPRYDMVAILVPAYGKCWVNKSDIVEEIPNLYIDSVYEAQWKLNTHEITQLSFRFSGEPNCQTHGALELLKLIGMPLKFLAIEFPRYDIWDSEHFNDLWESCPHLVEFCMENLGTTSLDIFVDAYASGKCRVSSLELFGCALIYKRSVRSFSKALGDPSSPLARTLQQLRLRLEDGIIVSDDEVDEELDDHEVVLAFLSALKTNQQLLYFELHVKSHVYEDYKEAFECLNGQYLSIVRHPLSMRAKCAFLSIVKKAHTEEDAFPIKGLASVDTHVLRRIFHMASEPEKRTVILEERSKMTGTPTFETRHLREGETRYGFGYPRTEELDD